MSDIRVSFPKPCDEPWEDMAKQGCNRHCATCDQTIFDLEKLTVDEAEALLDGADEVCVRARVGSDGKVTLAKGSSNDNRAIKAVMGAAATVALAACSSIGGEVSPRYTVSGDVNRFDSRATLELVGEGRSYKTSPKRDYSFQFTNLRPGTYQLSISDDCGAPHDLGEIVVSENSVDVGTVLNERACIIVGKMERADPPSRA